MHLKIENKCRLHNLFRIRERKEKNMKFKQNILPSAHLLEIFMPYRHDEPRMLEVFKTIHSFNYYQGFELGIFFNEKYRHAIRDIISENNLHLTTFITPYIKDENLNLCSLDREEQNSALDLALRLVELAADQGVKNLGIPSGDDPGDSDREEAKEVLAKSIGVIADSCARHDINLTIEPLDRYAYKKQLIGPMKETVEWLEPIHEKHPNFYIHWDSAHEVLGNTPIDSSLEYAKQYIAQFHLCNCITDVNHPFYGDLHMDVGIAPDYETDGFLTPEIGADIIKKVASFSTPKGVDNVFVSIEVLGHPGNDLWRKEVECREFLQKCFELANIN